MTEETMDEIIDTFNKNNLDDFMVLARRDSKEPRMLVSDDKNCSGDIVEEASDVAKKRSGFYDGS